MTKKKYIKNGEIITDKKNNVQITYGDRPTDATDGDAPPIISLTYLETKQTFIVGKDAKVIRPFSLVVETTIEKTKFVEFTKSDTIKFDKNATVGIVSLHLPLKDEPEEYLASVFPHRTDKVGERQVELCFLAPIKEN